jgi:hypothetical protein
MGPDLDAALGWTAKQSLLKPEGHLLQKGNLWSDTTQDHHLIGGVVIAAGVHRRGLSRGLSIAAKAAAQR